MKRPPPTSIGRAIQDAAFDLHVENRMLAHRLGVSRETLARWIHGRVVPSLDRRAQILNTLHDAPPAVRARLIEAFGLGTRSAPDASAPKPVIDPKLAIESIVRAAADELDVTARTVRDVLRAVLPRIRETGATLADVEAAVAREPSRKAVTAASR